MEIRLEAAEGCQMPTGSFLAVKLGDVLKQGRYEPSRTYQFPGQAEKRRHAKIDLFKLVGSSAVLVSPDGPTVSEVSITSGTENVRLKVDMKPQNARKSLASTTPLKSAVRSKAQTYLDKHGIEEKLSSCVKLLLQRQPEDPVGFICSYLRDTSDVTAAGAPPQQNLNSTAPAAFAAVTTACCDPSDDQQVATDAASLRALRAPSPGPVAPPEVCDGTEGMDLWGAEPAPEKAPSKEEQDETTLAPHELCNSRANAARRASAAYCAGIGGNRRASADYRAQQDHFAVARGALGQASLDGALLALLQAKAAVQPAAFAVPVAASPAEALTMRVAHRVQAAVAMPGTPAAFAAPAAASPAEDAKQTHTAVSSLVERATLKALARASQDGSLAKVLKAETARPKAEDSASEKAARLALAQTCVDGSLIKLCQEEEATEGRRVSLSERAARSSLLQATLDGSLAQILQAGPTAPPETEEDEREQAARQALLQASLDGSLVQILKNSAYSKVAPEASSASKKVAPEVNKKSSVDNISEKVTTVKKVVIVEGLANAAVSCTCLPVAAGLASAAAAVADGGPCSSSPAVASGLAAAASAVAKAGSPAAPGLVRAAADVAIASAKASTAPIPIRN